MLAARSGQAEVKLTSSFPRTGTVRVPVLLCAFPDQPFTVANPQTAFSEMLNSPNYRANNGTGSVSEYYQLSSNGKLLLRFDVFGPFTVSHNMEYYGGNTNSSHNKNAQELVSELINLAGNNGVDFSLYDADNNGVVDNVSVFVAGHNEAEGGDENTIWPHQSNLRYGPTRNGKSFSSYLMTSELRGASGSTMAGIGTYCHEFGHVLGLPDLYDTSNNTSEDKVYTIGSWDIMCNGSYNNAGRTPPLFSAFERYMLGWSLPTQLDTAGIYSLPPLEEQDTSFLLAASKHNLSPFSPSVPEFFMIENRQRTGWDGRHQDCLPGVGLLISHITFSSRTWDANTFNNSNPLGYDIVEAYNTHPTASAPNDTYPGTMNITTFTPVLNNGDSLHNLHLHNILQRSNGTVSFAMGQTRDALFTFTPAALDTFVTTFDGVIGDYTPQRLTVSGSGITSPTVIIALANNFFSLNAGGEWQRGGMFTDSVGSDGTYSRTLDLRFEPRRQSCIPTSSSLQVFTGDSSAFALLSVLGISPRPLYLTAPDSLFADKIETTSFRINWKESPDAESYFARAYSLDPITGTYQLAAEREAVAPAHYAYLPGLNANTTYLVTVTAYEQKSCYLHTAVSDTLTVSTLIDSDTKQALPVMVNADGSCTMLLPAHAESGMVVHLFSADGRLIRSLTVNEGALQVNIPTDGLTNGHLYLVKYSSATSMRRKDYFGKFIYR